MQILLLILKILGILLLIILALIAAIIIVPVRYRVSVSAGEEPGHRKKAVSVSEDDKNIKAGAVGSWFLHIIDVRVCYQKGNAIAYKIRIFGIPLKLRKKKQDKSVANGKSAKKHRGTKKSSASQAESAQESAIEYEKDLSDKVSQKKKAAEQENEACSIETEVDMEDGKTGKKAAEQEREACSIETEVDMEGGKTGKKAAEQENEACSIETEVDMEGGKREKKEEVIAENKTIIKEETIEKKEIITESKTISGNRNTGRSEKASNSKDTKKKKKRKTLKSRLQEGKEAICNLTDKLKQLASNLKNGTTTIKEQFRNIKSILSEETNKRAFGHMFQEIKYLMKHYLPKTVSGNVRFGTADPAVTGQVLGGISILPVWQKVSLFRKVFGTGRQWQVGIEPDFQAEQLYIRGNLSVKGHIRGIHLLISGIRLIKDKDIRRFIKTTTKNDSK